MHQCGAGVVRVGVVRGGILSSGKPYQLVRSSPIKKVVIHETEYLTTNGWYT